MSTFVPQRSAMAKTRFTGESTSHIIALSMCAPLS